MNAAELLRHGTALAGFSDIPADSCVVHDTGRPIKRALSSINATTGDLLLARELGCDAFLLHHPLGGSARRDFHHVFDRMIELMVSYGVPAKIATEAQANLRNRCRFNDHASDWDHLASAAELLDITLVNVHLPADELGRQVMVQAIESVAPDATIADVAAALAEIPELGHSINEILLVPDDADRPAGRVAVMHAGGTNGGAEVAACIFEHADPVVDTVIYIHLAGDAATQIRTRAASGERGSIIVTGHLASDAIGMNLLIHDLESNHGIEVIRHGGLRPFAATASRPTA